MSSAALVKTLVAIAAMAAVAELAAAAKTHTIQWSLGANYGDWSNSNAVSVGDTVVFTYSSPHTVDELLQADYGSCSFGSPVSTDQSGSTSFTFDKAETRYFACAAGGGSHCRQGQKVAITAGASSPGGQSPPATPSGNSAASSMVPGAGELAMKMALGLGVGGALLAAF